MDGSETMMTKRRSHHRLFDDMPMQYMKDFEHTTCKHHHKARFQQPNNIFRKRREKITNFNCNRSHHRKQNHRSCRHRKSPNNQNRSKSPYLAPLRKMEKSSLGLVSSIVVIIFIYAISFRPHTVSSEPSPFTMAASGLQAYNTNSGQFTISQLCAGKSQFPVTKRIEGAVLSSTADTNVNCTITFRTKSTQQHFVIRFEELKLGCDDHLKMFDSDLDYGQPSIKDFSCRDSLASVPTIKTTSTFLTVRFSSDSKTKPGDGFRLVATAVFEVPMWECPPEYSLCRNQLCISKSLFCDDINHCIDNSDELSCSSKFGGSGESGSIFAGELTLTNALGLLVVLVFIIFTCVIIFLLPIYCRQESNYAQYQHVAQHHPQGIYGVPLQTLPNRQVVMLLTNGP